MNLSKENENRKRVLLYSFPVEPKLKNNCNRDYPKWSKKKCKTKTYKGKINTVTNSQSIIFNGKNDCFLLRYSASSPTIVSYNFFFY